MVLSQDVRGASVRRRNRPTVVCTNCKRRKSKCDRQNPCSNCVRFGNKDTCHYVQNPKNTESQHGEDTDNKVKKQQPQMIKGKRNGTSSSIVGSKASSISPTGQSLDVPLVLSGKNYVNLSPSGNFVEFKRSAVTMFSYFCKRAIQDRDLYLKALVTFRSIAVEMTTNTLRGTKNYSKNPSLPESFKPLSIFDADGDPLSSDSLFRQHQLIHKSLFDKYGKYRKDEAIKIVDVCELLNDNLPSRSLFIDHILVHFESHVIHMVPIFEMEFLKYDVNNFYDKWEQSREISVKDFDHMVCCVILLITKICILSTKFARLPSELLEHFEKLDTSKYIAIIHYYMFEMKSLRKCTLRQLQILLLLRFYHWCAPEDGDGDSLQHSHILMGTIIASCQEMGISWLCIRDPGIYWFQLFGQSKRVPFILSPEDFKIIYQMIWSYVLHWDRKMFLINGQECLIGKSHLYDVTGQELSWHHRMVALDHIIMKMNDILNDSPSRVDIVALKQEWNNALRIFELIRDTKKEHLHLNFEYETTLELFRLCLSHAELTHLEQVNDVESFHLTVQSLWDQIVKLASKCHRYFYGPQEMDPYSRFFTNKIISVVADKLCTLIPAFVLRLNRFGEMGFDQMNMMVKFLFGVCSMYYNELGFDYYRCFESMFTAKISYKILNRPRNKNPWEIILEFLLCQLEKEGIKDQLRELKIIQNLPVLVSLRESLNLIPEYHRDAVKLWNTDVVPIGHSSVNFTLNLREESLEPFLVDRYSQTFNIFTSFYDHASSQLAEEAEDTSSKIQYNVENSAEQAQEIAETNAVPVEHPLSLEPTNPVNLEESNLELIRNMFEPLDFISFF
ncbi:ZYRO0D02090p [Zygosaccharomyces rouxii]|uniref:Oleate activated transcription factor 3 n=1 Tax=Zygosaccharomyces rouxii (strain ATCC 2623 / CBS 732 / NBRC 1130 / NCYC 568 / NRRL Y-229) TaxID=559307 RepID=OAF3_ZYGRC|nr:uncharacterized protein ZYRO0D02090g [Zygosaccharomyces rouxii]C5DUX2.1 RecName: Full=Oleate activated transcription factor 3 [Zygosaccharomyces rouxii CBS 732]KAH9200507.1 oleate activated transcription factor 3 [Zygosaccharomyces rouxii]CAR27591.1 ZYRO0D02090p [Zygosaccharomyces rouxii]